MSDITITSDKARMTTNSAPMALRVELLWRQMRWRNAALQNQLAFIRAHGGSRDTRQRRVMNQALARTQDMP